MCDAVLMPRVAQRVIEIEKEGLGKRERIMMQIGRGHRMINQHLMKIYGNLRWNYNWLKRRDEIVSKRMEEVIEW